MKIDTAVRPSTAHASPDLIVILDEVPMMLSDMSRTQAIDALGALIDEVNHHRELDRTRLYLEAANLERAEQTGVPLLFPVKQ